MLRFLRLFVFFILASQCLGEGLVYLRIDRPVIEERLKLSPEAPAARVQALLSMFKNAGCTGQQISEQEVHGQELPNLICSLPGSEEGTIIIGAPLDYQGQGNDARANWGSLVMLPLLAESLNSVSHRYTLAFVAFTGNNHGGQGASWYVDQLSKSQRASVRAVLDLETLGSGAPVYKLAQEDHTLAMWLEIAAGMVRLPYLPVSIDKEMDDSNSRAPGPKVETASMSWRDVKPFGKAHIPAIGIQSAPAEAMSALNPKTYDDTYKLLCVYLLTLDRGLGRQMEASGPLMASTSSAAPLASTAPASAPAQASSPSVQATGPTGTQVATATPQPAIVSQEPPPMPIFHTKAQLVQVDVTVRNKQGDPVKGLTAADFTVLENGKSQQVRVFEAHAAASPAEIEAAKNKPPAVPMPPHTFTNRNVEATDDSLGIVLFDLKNTPVKDQAFAKAQMLKFLKQFPHGHHLALFVLGTHLQTLQKFTESSDELAKSVEKLMASQSQLLTTLADKEQFEADNDFVGLQAAPVLTGQAAAAAGDITGANNIDFGHARARDRSEAVANAHRDAARVEITLDAMNIISRVFAAYQGRKNLIWLSAGFPVELKTVSPTTQEFTRGAAREPLTDAGGGTANFQPKIQEAMALLAAARIAVYPIDVHGLQTGMIDISNGRADVMVTQNQGNTSGLNRVTSDQSDDRFQTKSAMNAVADLTGGEVFANTNDVRLAIARSVEDGSNYYTLGYTPDREGPDQEFRHIEVKIDRSDVQMAYRRGYYPKPKKTPSPEESVHALAAAMMPETPASTMLLVTATVLPPDATHKQAVLDYKIDLAGVEFSDAPDQRKQALIDCMAIAFDKNGNDVGHVANTLGLTVNPAQYDALARDGVPMHQEMTLPVGTYTLRIGVMDRLSQKVGTLEVPLVVSEQAAKN
jgi:VWFA-related protein